MTRVWPFSIGFLAPPLVFVAVGRGGWWSLLPVLLLYAGLPVGDALLGLSARIHGPDEIARLSEAWSFRLITWLWVPVQAALVLWAVHRFATAPLTPVEQVGLLPVVNASDTSGTYRLGATTVSITHDMASARKIADDIAMIFKGEIIWQGPAKTIDTSGNAYVDQFIHGRAAGPIQMDVLKP